VRVPRAPGQRLSRSLSVVVAAALLAAPQPSAARAGWAHRQIAFVLARGLFPAVRSVADFNGGRPLRAGALARLAGAVPGAPTPPAPADPSATVTIHQLNAAFVQALDLGDVAVGVTAALRADSLAPHRGAGVEIVARTLGLRFNHPIADDRLEPLPSDVASRAEGAYTAWRALRLDAGEIAGVRSELTALSLPSVSAAALPALRRAIGVVGAPYVFGGAALADGGFDCSGLVTMAEQGAAWLGGRSSYDMARATPPGERLTIDQLQPGDLVLFGPRGPSSAPGTIGHVGLALGGGWFVHAGSQGVTLETLDLAYFQRTFAWGRRPPQ
jgi:hypothetical protein